MANNPSISIGVLTSGGDAQGMNAAVRAVVRSALHLGATVHAIFEGYQGMVDGGDRIRAVSWDDVGSILHRGGTVIGTARCPAFREREGRLRAAHNLIRHGIDRLVVIGGDGSLTGADTFRHEWSELVAELVARGEIDEATAQRHPALMIAGLVGSIDNDMVGTDMTIGADSALHRIIEAIDAITSTAASHQRSFVVEVMGRHCGYLALMSAIAGGADYVLIPENPPPEGWEDQMCALLRNGRAAGRRDSIVIVAEGASDRAGNPLNADYVRQVLEDRLGEDTRVTILGHVQRGGTPSAFDRWMSTVLGFDATETVLSATPESDPVMIGIRYNRIDHAPLMECVQKTRSVAQKIADKDYEGAMALRGGSFTEMFEVFRRMAESMPSVTPPTQPRRLAILHAGGLAPGMNPAVRAAVRLGLDLGHVLLGVRGGFQGLIDGRIEELKWGDVEGWTSMGGAELGTNRQIPTIEQFYSVGRALETQRIDGLLIIGGWAAYKAIYELHRERDRYPAFKIPMICLPATIDNNLPGSEQSVGADTALNVIVEALDRIKQSATAARRCFVIETMGTYCGYLALLSGLAGGAERVYLHEEGITLKDLQADVENMLKSFEGGRRLYMAIRNERASPHYTTDFLCRLFEEESQTRFDVRQDILGHIQQGGNPSPFDRILATRLATRCIDYLTQQLAEKSTECAFIGLSEGKVTLFPLKEMADMVDWSYRRPKKQWWLGLRTIVHAMAQPSKTTTHKNKASRSK
ncbi:MAG: 6-phosphofructokinase [Phycisphaerales bacterium]|nr:6-phosphofructokinase [Phycisphaerales bacterium]